MLYICSMRPQKVLDKEIIDGLTQVFRTKGYEGASLKELAEVTGLKKASLYHRFPNGKEEMASAVLSNSVKWGEEVLFEALANEEDTPKKRLKQGLAHIRSIYKGGEESCVFRAMSMQTGLELFETQLHDGMGKWVKAFKDLGLAFGLTAKTAADFAEQTLIDIQGSLVVTKCMGDTSIFDKALKRIENRYINN